MPGLSEDPEVLRDTAEEGVLDAVSAEDAALRADSGVSVDEAAGVGAEKGYEEAIQEALSLLESRADEYLSPEGLAMLSPKFLRIIAALKSEDFQGKHLIYSQFRTLEGIGVLSLALEANGFRRFRLKREGTSYTVDLPSGTGPVFALYTGTESSEEKEMVRNIFNGDWQYIPPALAKSLAAIHADNTLGEVIQTLMITASGAEGISLKNVRYVHITEPYWHPVRLTQVIGRARRICSHVSLPPELQTVEVFLYLMTFSPNQLDSDEAIELRLKDTSRLDGRTPVTSDQHLYEIATAKADIAEQLMEALKAASIDCAVHKEKGEKCFAFGSTGPDKFASAPSLANSDSDEVTAQNQTEIKFKAKELTMNGIKYALDEGTGRVYDLAAYKADQLVEVGVLEIGETPAGRKTYRIVLGPAIPSSSSARGLAGE